MDRAHKKKLAAFLEKNKLCAKTFQKIPYSFEIDEYTEEQYLSRIRQLESEIEYLHGLLDDAGISYKREAKELDDWSPDRNSNSWT